MTKNNEKVKAITEDLETGVLNIYESGRYQEYLDFVAKFHHYSANNIVLILKQKPDATLVAGYKAWGEKFGRRVKTGAKGIHILAPMQRKFTRQVADENGDVVDKEYQYTAFRIVYVFDVADTEGSELPSLQVKELDGDVEAFDAIMEKLTDIAPVPVTWQDIKNGAKGYYSHIENRIVLNSGMSHTQTIKTLIHETAHAMLHSKSGEQAEADRETREVQAESVAYTVCRYLGLDTSEYSFGYIAGWSTGKEIKELQKSMEVIRRTAQTIIKRLEDKPSEAAA